MYRFKQAETEAEFEQIFRLNHRTFVDELHQYTAAASPRLIDKFHDKNLYWIALAGEEVIGMIAAHDRPPFSIESRLADVRVLEPYGRVFEVRLLAVHPAHRKGLVMAGLFLQMYERARDYDALIISGLVEESALYHRIGFEDLGPPVRSGEAEFVPMVARVADLAEQYARWRKLIGVGQRHALP
jgi:predicted N-acetyltransferase YhbS